MANPSCVYVVMDNSEGDDVCTPYIECAYVSRADAALDVIEKYIAESEGCYDCKEIDTMEVIKVFKNFIYCPGYQWHDISIDCFPLQALKDTDTW